ncbi:hypothetical protein SDC9_177278 [bioreactor metagenome]|uniref:Uncharacterized protein n=1 Tax=bioreactor metagenome TaxID=1076179 RepID=A0A645GSU9_9ZZZZ
MKTNKNIKAIIKIGNTLIPKITIKIILSNKYNGNNILANSALYAPLYILDLSLI